MYQGTLFITIVTPVSEQELENVIFVRYEYKNHKYALRELKDLIGERLGRNRYSHNNRVKFNYRVPRCIKARDWRYFRA